MLALGQPGAFVGSSVLWASSSLWGISTKAEHELSQIRAFYASLGSSPPHGVTCALVGWCRLLGSEAEREGKEEVSRRDSTDPRGY